MISPPMNPTEASTRPFPSKFFRNKCSTPQKQPAATMHTFDASGMLWVIDVLSGFRLRRVEEVKGRMSRARKLGIAPAMRMMRMETARIFGCRSLGRLVDSLRRKD